MQSCLEAITDCRRISRRSGSKLSFLGKVCEQGVSCMPLTHFISHRLAYTRRAGKQTTVSSRSKWETWQWNRHGLVREPTMFLIRFQNKTGRLTVRRPSPEKGNGRRRAAEQIVGNTCPGTSQPAGRACAKVRLSHGKPSDKTLKSNKKIAQNFYNFARCALVNLRSCHDSTHETWTRSCL